ncbi:MAG: hypothetical protein QW767_03350 [Thermoprotei archaeon]
MPATGLAEKISSTMENVNSFKWKPFRVVVVLQLVLLSLQGWTGDFVNVFVTTSPTNVGKSLQGFFAAITSRGPFLEWHAFEGSVALLLGVVVAAYSFAFKRRSVRFASILAVLSVFASGLGGFLFVLSGFSAGGSSMQMGGSYIAAYALYFVTLWYTK